VELPDIVALDRRFRGPWFETVTVSADEREGHEKAPALLRKAGAQMANHRFEGELPELVGAVHPGWTGALPFALLVEPGGRVLMKSEGTLELDRLRQTIEDWLAKNARE
jgi:hypothetical protein